MNHDLMIVDRLAAWLSKVATFFSCMAKGLSTQTFLGSTAYHRDSVNSHTLVKLTFF